VLVQNAFDKACLITYAREESQVKGEQVITALL